MWSSYHTHNTYCDGASSISEVVEVAINQRVFSLGISSHAPLPFAPPWSMKSESFTNYIKEIESLQKQTSDIQLYKGLEVDFIPGVRSPNDFASHLDYTIGSVHFVDVFDDGTPWEIDGSHQLFERGLAELFKNDYKQAFSRYFELTREMIRTACPTIIGHMDKMKIQNKAEKYFQESEAWYQSEVEATLKLIKEAGAIVEVNTRGIYQNKSTTTYPSPWILNRIHELNIPITINSDAHHSRDLIQLFSETAHLLNDIGFKKVSVLHHGTWTSFPFNQYGISIH